MNYIIKKDNKCFQYALFMRKQEENSEAMTKLKPFINKYKQEGIGFPSREEEWKKFEKNNVTIALNVSHTRKRKNVSCLCFKK